MKISAAKEICKQSVAIAVISCGTQEKLAKKAKITQGAIGKYLRGDALPKGETAKNLSLAVGGAQPPSDFAPHIFDRPCS